MLRWGRQARILILLLAGQSIPAMAQTPANGRTIVLTVVDENGVPVSDAQVTVREMGVPPLASETDYLGRSSFSLPLDRPYQIEVDKPGFYRALASQLDPASRGVTLTLAHQQVVREQVDVVASTPGIDPEQTSGIHTLSTPEIVNIPYPVIRDIRNLLRFSPGVVQDISGQPHVSGGETYQTLDLLDGFAIRSPASGQLALRVSTDVVRSIDVQNTRYPVQYGRSTAGVIAFYTGMGDNRFRFNATDFLPSVRELNGLHFDKFAPRLTFSGPLVKNTAWFLDGFELEYGNIFIPGLPGGANTSQLWREGNLSKTQINLSPRNILIGGLLFNNYSNPYEGLSTLVPQPSTRKHTTIAWLPYLRYQHSLPSGLLIELGIGASRIHDGYEPRGNLPFEITPEGAQGSYFESETGRSSRIEETAIFHVPPHHLAGSHLFEAGLDFDQIDYGETVGRQPISYLAENGMLLRQSVFPSSTRFMRHNAEAGGYVEDHWKPVESLVLEPGVRFDWDQIVRRPLYSPRLALTYTRGTGETATKISGGAGLYYEHTQLEYLERAFAGIRYDTYYAPDGVTPLAPPLETNFVAENGSLREARALNWSVGMERRLPAAIYATAGYMERRGRDGFIYSAPAGTAAPSGAAAFSGTYLLTNGQKQNYRAADLSLRRTFAHGYTLFGSYTRSSARTNTALDYAPGLSILGPQQSGPLPWDTPNRFFTWGWQPVPKLQNWDFVYSVDWRTGFPFTSVDANYVLAGLPGSNRFPDYFSFTPGLEWRFHLRGSYFGLRAVIENITDRPNPTIVNNVVDSPQYEQFTEPEGRSLVARVRLISSK